MAAATSFELRDLVAGPPDMPILRGLSVEIACVGITSIAGASGSGKSTLLRLLNRLDDPISGSILWGGRPLDQWPVTELRRRVAMVFQRPPVFAGTVFDNLAVARPSLSLTEAGASLEGVGLPSALLTQEARDLSGGEAQRMCFARALLTDPDVVLADEPTASLDSVARDRIEALGRRLADDGVPVIWVTHDTDQLQRLADRVIVLGEHRVLAAGPLAELVRHDDQRVRTLVGGVA